MKYLKQKWSALLIRDAVLYLAFAGGIFFAGRPLVGFSIGFWILFGVLMLIEGFGTYTLIHEHEVVRSAWFFKWKVPFDRIIGINKGKFYGVGNPESVIFNYKLENGKDTKDYILPSQYSKEEITKFISALKSKIPDLKINV